MIWLFLLICTGTWIATIFKFINMRHVRAGIVICINYLIGSLAAAISFFAGTNIHVSHDGSFAAMLILSFILGIFMRTNLLVTDKSTVENGVGSTTFFNRIAFFPSVIISAVLWDGMPQPIQIAGLLLVIIAMLGMVKSMSGINVNEISLILGLIGSAAAIELCNKIFSVYFDAELKPIFLIGVFGSAFVTALAAILHGDGEPRGTITTEEIIFGALLGIPNVLNNYFKLQSLEILPSAVVMASFAVGTMVLSAIIGVALFKEKINSLRLGAIILAVLSIVMINLPG